MLESLSEALDNYEDFREPLLNFYQLYILAKLLDSPPWEDLIPTIANTHRAYLDLAIDKFSGTDPDQVPEFLSNYSNEKSILLLETHLQMLVNWQTTLSGRKRCFLLYSEDQPLNGTRTKLPTQQPGRMFQQISSLDFQTAETNSHTTWRWNIVLEELEKKFGTFYTVSDERLIKAGPMIWTVLRLLNKMPNLRLKDDKGDKDTLITH